MLAEALDDQRQELTRRTQLEVEKAREEERSLQVARLTDAVELLQKMESYLIARKLLDEASKKVSANLFSYTSTTWERCLVSEPDGISAGVWD